jgi:aryl-alcohol dehydrogenase-like predicted oxidoreductase
MQLLDELEALAGSWGLTLPQLAIRFAIDTPGVDVVVVGASNAGELEIAQAARDTPPLGRDRMQTLARFDRSSESWSHPETWTVQAR